MPRPKLSAVIITHMEEKVIGSCLDALSFCDEIVVVDSHSSDNTVAICTQKGARVVDQPWLGFGPQKQLAVSLASHDWVLCIDADEIVSGQLKAAIEMALDAPSFDTYQMPRCNLFLGRHLRHGEGYPDWSLRLFNRNRARWSDDLVHEKVLTDSTIGKLNCDLIHNSADSLEKYLTTQNRYTSLQAQALIARGKKVGAAKILLSPLFRFLKFYFIRLGFLDGLPGLIHISIGCFNSFNKYAKVYEAQSISCQQTRAKP